MLKPTLKALRIKRVGFFLSPLNKVMRIFNYTMDNDDEYYTQKEDVEKTLDLFDFSDKIVYCPCDSDESEFVKYFKRKPPKELIYTSDDFRTHKDLFEKADVVVTNPPFNLKLVLMDDYIKSDFILVLPFSTRLNKRDDESKDFRFWYTLHNFKRPDGTFKDVYCQFVSTFGTKEHPFGLTFKELFGKDMPLTKNGGVIAVRGFFKGQKFKKAGGFNPFLTKPFIVSLGNRVAEFKHIYNEFSLGGDLVEWREEYRQKALERLNEC